jgi:DNA-binding transcriptional MerR regulator
MTPSERELTIDELADAVGVPVRTVRYYIAEGLLSGPEGRGKTAFYGEEHEDRLRLIRLLVERRVPLAEIRERLNGLTRDDVRALLAQETSQTAELQRAAQAPSPRDYVAALLRQAQTTPPLAEPPAAYQRQPAPPVASRFPSFLKRKPPPPPPDHWQRWELAPGVELHARADAAHRFRELIERLLREAGKTER